jgi:hypothetical protein
MSNSNIFLNHAPEGTALFYEFHKDRPLVDLDYHQAYMNEDVAESSLLTPEHKEWVEKVAAIREEYASKDSRLYVEWDNPGAGPLQTPAVFIDFGSWWKKAEHNLTADNWVPFITKFLDAAKVDFVEEDLPEFPNVGSTPVIAIGVFPARIGGEVWIRVVCCDGTTNIREFVEGQGFSTNWFDEFDVSQECASCLISFDLYKNRVERPAAEMILKGALRGAYGSSTATVFPEFQDKVEEARKIITDAHGSYHKSLNLCHFKVELTDKGFENRDVKMYFIATTK